MSAPNKDTVPNVPHHVAGPHIGGGKSMNGVDIQKPWKGVQECLPPCNIEGARGKQWLSLVTTSHGPPRVGRLESLVFCAASAPSGASAESTVKPYASIRCA